MNKLRAGGVIAVVATALLMAGCHKNVTAQNQANDLGPDPAAANMAPGDPSGTNEAVTAAQTAQPTDQTAETQSADQGYTDDSNDVDYDDAAAQADQAPPPLPDYDQPPLPGDGYIWTPGYWAWATDGYYWVPGAWTMPPYEGALWTPGWWGFHSGRYFFFRGYWGHYIGYYGGVNYGYGYDGRGYEGGYWRGNRFQYNSAVNVIHGGNVNVYSHAVASPGARYSFNGPGGARLRPAPAELNAMRQPRVAPMSTQVQAQREAQQNRGQFANQNHGRPAAAAAPHPIAADTHTQPLAPSRIQPQQSQPQQQRRGNQMQGPQNRPAPQSLEQQSRPQPAPQQTLQSRPAPQQGQPRQFQSQPRPEQTQPAQRQQFTPQSRPTPQPRPTVQPQQRPAPQPAQHPENFSRPAPQPEVHSQPAPQVHPQPQMQPRPAPQPHPAPQSRPAQQGGGERPR